MPWRNGAKFKQKKTPENQGRYFIWYLCTQEDAHKQRAETEKGQRHCATSIYCVQATDAQGPPFSRLFPNRPLASSMSTRL